MAEVEATLPENIENSEAPPEPQEPPAPESTPTEPAKRGRGRPPGAKDRAPRVTKPKVRAEPIPQPQAKAAPEAAQEVGISGRPTPTLEERKERRVGISQIPTPVVEERPPSPEPPSPRTLFRQTSAHLLNLRDVMNSHKRASAAERYTSRLHAWPVV